MSMKRANEALRAAGAGAWEWDIVSDHLEWSNEMFSLLGLDPSLDRATCDSWNSNLHPDDRQRAMEDVQWALREGIPIKGSYRVVRPDGETAWIKVLGRTEQDERGRAVRMRGICIDVTEDRKAETALSESLKRYQALIEENIDIVWEVDPQGRFTYCSPQMERRWGLRREDFLGRTPFDLMPASEGEKARAMLSRIALSSDPFIGLRTFAYDGHGDLIYLETSGVPFNGEDGALLGYRGVTRDITVRERREMNLAFLAQISEGFGLLASPEEMVEMVGPRLMERLNIACFFLAEIDAEGDHIIVEHTWQRSPEISQISGVHRLSDFFSEEYLHLASSRSTFVVRDASTDPRIDRSSHLTHGILSYVAIPFQGANKRTYISTVIDDRVHDWREDEIELIQELTNRIVPRIERAQAEKALRESEVHLARAQQIAKLGSWSWSIDTDEIYWSDETFRIFGIRPNSIVPMYRDFISFVHSDDRERVERTIGDAMVDGRLDIEYRIVKPSGEERYVHCQGTVTYTGSGHRFKMEGAIHDITEWKRLQLDLERSNAELQQFAYITSHDLQEPLRMVTAYLSLLEKKHGNELSPAAREYMGFAVEGSVRMRELINGLLKFSRIERMGSKFSTVDMNKIAHMVKDDLKVSIGETGAEVIVEPLPTVFADEMQIRQVLQNLVSNAIKFHGPETPHIEVTSRSEGAEFVFAVKDNGIGIEPKYHGNLFKMFQRLHTQDEYPGTGIGLAISRKIVERHGGRIWLESDGENGSTFFFSLLKC